MSQQYALQEAKGDAVCFVPGSPLFSVLMEPASFCYPRLTFLRSPYGQFGASAGSSQDLAPWPQRLVPQRWSRPVDGAWLGFGRVGTRQQRSPKWGFEEVLEMVGKRGA